MSSGAVPVEGLSKPQGIQGAQWMKVGELKDP